MYSSKIQVTRGLLLVAILLGLLLGVIGIFIGLNIPGLVLRVTGWGLVIFGIVSLVNHQAERSRAASRPGSWRPGDQN